MKILFIMPSIGSMPDKKYIKTWQMEPLSIAVLKSLTPKNIQTKFFDERIEEINFEEDCDLVALTVETYTARRAYEISTEFRRRGKKVIMGGFHPTLVSNEAKLYCDSIVVGEVESVWENILDNFKKNKLKKIYKSKRPKLSDIFPDRSIYKDKQYLNIGLIESSRGCKFKCDFCSITNFYNQSFNYRPVKDIIKEIKSIKRKFYFFVDDNICADHKRAKELFEALIPLKIKWFSQGDIRISNDKELLRLMKKSGCEGILIGFESLNKKVLKDMKKGINISINLNEAINNIHNMGLKIYATFVFGYDEDTTTTFKETYKFAIKHKFFLTAFNHLVPFPGTNLYNRLKNENRLKYKKWWLDHSYHFGEVAFHPKNFNENQLTDLCYKYRKKFYTLKSITKRLFNLKPNFSSLTSPFKYLFANILMRKDVDKRQNIHMGRGNNFERI